MTRRGHARIFLDDGNCEATVMLVEEPEQSFVKFGITNNNVMELVQVLTDRHFHVTLHRLTGSPTFHVYQHRDHVLHVEGDWARCARCGWQTGDPIRNCGEKQ